MSLENDLDFLSLIGPDGKYKARAFQLECNSLDLADNSIVSAAKDGKGASGMRLGDVKGLIEENPTLAQRFGTNLPKDGLMLVAAYPVFHESNVIGVIYGGILINNNHLIVERIAQRLFHDTAHKDKELGFVAIFQGTVAISSSLRGQDRLPLVGFELNQSLRSEVSGKRRNSLRT